MDYLRRCDPVIVNHHELGVLGAEVDDVASTAAATAVRARGALSVVATLGANAAPSESTAAAMRRRRFRVVDGAGAGDLFVSILAAPGDLRTPMDDAVSDACAAASMSVVVEPIDFLRRVAIS